MYVGLDSDCKLSTPLPPLGHIWDVMLVWRCMLALIVIANYPPLYLHLATSEMWCWSGGRGILIKKCLCVTVLCIIIMVYKDTSQSTVSGFDLAWFSSVVEAPLCLWSSWCYIDIKFFLLTSFSLPFSELSLVGLAQGSPGWLTIFLQCYDAVGWVMWPGPLGIPVREFPGIWHLALPNSRR